ncbi:hypothetical protein [Nannocystis pusilla]|uniref:hypothetical protein n=1 Tax=Nannocystis pusilla TaxID=889268 RepID=UPI003B7A0E89
MRVFDMRRDPWEDLGTQLRTLSFNPSAERRAVVVITPSNLDRTAARDGLAAFNFSRDSIADNLQCPLLWCGDIQLLRTTAELATDFWSIAATVYRIPLRALSDLPFGPMHIIWSGVAKESVETLAARLNHAWSEESLPASSRPASIWRRRSSPAATEARRFVRSQESRPWWGGTSPTTLPLASPG